MLIPRLFQNVRIRGRDEVFYVFWVNEMFGTAHLQPVGIGKHAVRFVPFVALQPLEEDRMSCR